MLWGLLLYECLTGRPPFQAATVLDTLLQVVSNEPVPPSRLENQTPRDLETICLKCLRKKPSQRYVSAEALAEDLARFRRGERIAARPVGRLERGIRWIRRNSGGGADGSVGAGAGWRLRGVALDCQRDQGGRRWRRAARQSMQANVPMPRRTAPTTKP